MVDWGRIATGVATGGLSELGGARPLAEAAGHGLGMPNFLTNKNVPTQLKDRDKISGLIDQGMSQYTQTAAPQTQAATAQGSQLNMGADPFRAGQMQQVGQLQGLASGQQMGAGEMAARRAAQQAIAGQHAQATMNRGGNAPGAYLAAARNIANIGGNLGGQAQQAALQDQSQAQAALTGALGQGRGMDVNVAGQNAQLAQQLGLTNAGFQQQAGLANAQMTQQQQQQNAQNYMQLLQQLYGLNATELGFAQAPVMAANQAQAGLVGAGIGAAGTALGEYMKSDERAKTSVADAGREVDEMLDKLMPKAWVYKDKSDGDGRWTGVMAQALEKSKAGARIVEDTPGGKMLDVKKAVAGALASVARLNQRLRAVEHR